MCQTTTSFPTLATGIHFLNAVTMTLKTVHNLVRALCELLSPKQLLIALNIFDIGNNNNSGGCDADNNC